MSSSREKLLAQFRGLVGERLERIGKGLMDLEAGPNAETGKQALRELHGLKGESRMMGFAEVSQIVHEMEGLVRAAEPGGFALSGGSIDALLACADAVLILSGAAQGPTPEVAKLTEWLQQRVAAEVSVHGPKAPAPQPSTAQLATNLQAVAQPVAVAEQKAPTEQPAAARPKSAELKTEGMVRIGKKSLETLTEAVTSLNQIVRRRELGAARRLAMARELSLLSREAEDLGGKHLGFATRLNRIKELAFELHREGKLLANEELKDLTQLSDEIHELRMMPVSLLFEPYARMVRDLSRELGKEVELVVEGEETRADRGVVEALKDPLLHLVRNAIDHGLEASAARQRAGKSARGRLLLRGAREGERLLLTVEDDGRGLDPAELRAAAVRKGLFDTAGAAALSDSAVRDLVFLPGFTSREVASDISGRGVGLDAVRTRLQSLGGDATVRSETGKGAIFELRVPVSLTVAPLLFVEAGDERLCLTASHVVQALKVQKDQVEQLAGKPALKVDEAVLPFASIASILGAAPERPPTEGEMVLLVEGQGTTAAISVDRVLEERVQAILPLRGILSRFKHLAGATPLVDGSLSMVLSASHLISAAQGISPLKLSSVSASKGAEDRRRRLLVVDDSPLTRELISSLLEAVGYEIMNASDGIEGFERLQREQVDMVVTDLEMPRMDGLELTRRIKSHPTLRALPVVIVTTRGAEADRRRGMEAGADGYIAKGDLVRQDLVDVVARLLG